MDINKVRTISTSMSAFITFLGILFALIYYFYQFKKLNFLEIIIISEIYILFNLTFLYILTKRLIK